MSLQTIGTCLVALGLLVGAFVGLRGEEDGLLILPAALTTAGLFLAIIGRKPNDPV